MSTTFIYALCEPDTGDVRYVGKADNPTKRLMSHLKAKERCHRTYWLQKLSAQGLMPSLKILDKVPASEWPQWEVAWIEFFKEAGSNLVNSNLGGEGGHSPSEETRNKIRLSKLGKNNPNFGKKYSSEECAIKSALFKGKKLPPRSEEHCAKISAGKLGKKPTPEARANQSAAQLGKKHRHHNISDIGRAKMREAGKATCELMWAKRKGLV